MSEDIQPAPCSKCTVETAHDVLHRAESWDDDFREEYALIKCRGCGTVSMREVVLHASDEGWGKPRYYPSPLSRKPPFWAFELQMGLTSDKEGHRVGNLLLEVYEAVRAGHHRLAAMGVRAILENVMIAKVGDQHSFKANLDAFQKAGYLSLIGRDAMSTVLEVGDAAIHRLHAPSEEDLDTALDVLEGILAPIYSHMKATEQMAARTPKRPPRKPKT